MTDRWLLFLARAVRMFAYGFLSVVLVLYLRAIGLEEGRIGLLLTLTLLGDTAVSLWLTTAADRLGRRKMLLAGALLMALAGGAFAATDHFGLLLLAAIIGVISPSGNEVGPFLPIEQAALSQDVPEEDRTRLFAWYNLTGSAATALGALAGGLVSELCLRHGFAAEQAYRHVVVAYAVMGVVLCGVFTCLTPKVETPQLATHASHLGLHRSRPVVFKLASLFALDAFGGGFIVQSLLVYWFHVRHGLEPAMLGGLFFAANLLAAASALAASSLAKRWGLVRTMVFTHLPSNVLLILVPLMPSLPWAIAVLLLRFAISQMDVPTRQSYTLAVVEPDERSAAGGVCGVARSLGAASSPWLAGMLMAQPALFSAPFFLAGGIKIIYDVWLYRAFVTADPPVRENRCGQPPVSA